MKPGAFFLIHKPKNNHLNDTHQVLLGRRKFVLTSPKENVFNYQGLVYYEFIKEGVTINKQAYKEILKKRNQLFKSKQWKLLHDNAPAHRAIIVQDYLAKHSVSVLPHPPYSPDIAPCDFFFFPKLKMTLKGRRFSSSSEVIENATLSNTYPKKVEVGGLVVIEDDLHAMGTRGQNLPDRLGIRPKFGVLVSDTSKSGEMAWSVKVDSCNTWCAAGFLAKLFPTLWLNSQHSRMVAITFPSRPRCALWVRDQATLLAMEEFGKIGDNP
ncbi:hypothetical protein LAZ67_12001768 [Cordylochernes scorpioides]|uniref:Tc1-like transposase DDE domain-containing protein n=1 Tax=Cordylochernes scorpioides TaxID=51811 RepID=A0ABY6L4T3_9ARAC|nr:hypothetical protein LAZ67_12001768 [Cordylochernes scorpioides]